MRDLKSWILPVSLGVAIAFAADAHAEPDCQSELGAHLKPLTARSPFSWGAEIAGQAGFLANNDLDRTLAHGQAILGLQYQAFAGRLRLYTEGSFKDFYKSDDGPGLGGAGTTFPGYHVPEKRQWGLRAGFLEYHTPKTTLTLGLQTMSLGETLLLDERGLGLSAKSEIGPLTLRLAAATVTADFAKMQDFCAVRHTYTIVRGGRLDLLGDALGETNLAGVALEYAPRGGRAAQSPSADVDDDEFEAIESVRPGVIRRIGLLYLQEFGDGFGRYRQFFGATAALRGPGGLDAQLEAIYQDIPTKSAVGYLARVDRDFAWNSGTLTRLALGYVGSQAVDEYARFSPAFANLFLGEIMRLDVARAPLAFARVEHTLAVKMRPYARLFYVAQLEDDTARELDLELGLRVIKGARVFIAQGWIQSDALPSATRTSRLGLRWAF